MGQIKCGRVSRHDDYATNEVMTPTTGRPSAVNRATSEVMTPTTQTVRRQPRSNQRGDDADDWQTVRLQPRSQRGDDADDWQTVRRQPRSQRDDDAGGWQTVRRQPRSNQPPAPRHTTGPTHTTCFFCGEGGQVRNNCSHSGKVECNSCHRLGHKAKFCTQ